MKGRLFPSLKRKGNSRREDENSGRSAHRADGVVFFKLTEKIFVSSKIFS